MFVTSVLGLWNDYCVIFTDTSCGKTKKCRWTIDEQEALTAEFGDIFSMEKLPSLKECMRVVSENEVLCCRTPAQVKTFIDNKRKKGKKKIKVDINDDINDFNKDINDEIFLSLQQSLQQ